MREASRRERKPRRTAETSTQTDDGTPLHFTRPKPIERALDRIEIVAEGTRTSLAPPQGPRVATDKSPPHSPTIYSSRRCGAPAFIEPAQPSATCGVASPPPGSLRGAMHSLGCGLHSEPRRATRLAPRAMPTRDSPLWSSPVATDFVSTLLRPVGLHRSAPRPRASSVATPAGGALLGLEPRRRPAPRPLPC